MGENGRYERPVQMGRLHAGHIAAGGGQKGGLVPVQLLGGGVMPLVALWLGRRPAGRGGGDRGGRAVCRHGRQSTCKVRNESLI